MTTLSFRRAIAADLPSLLALINDDVLGKNRDPLGDTTAPHYQRAFAAIDADANQFLILLSFLHF